MIPEKLIISDEELKKYNSTETLSDKAGALILQQNETWELCSKNYTDLAGVEIKDLDFDGVRIRVQFNPARIISSAAKVDAASLKERKCFLCLENLPDTQKAVVYDGSYLILVNPFPIFPKHLTIPRLDHVPQLISGNFEDMLGITRAIGKEFVVFYNGPKCGASAPDHMHFQAGNRGFMPIDEEYDEIKEKSGKKLYDEDGLSIYAVDNYLRRYISLESADKARLVEAFDLVYEKMEKLSENGEEPPMNILSYYIDGKWRAIVFPRDKHRPDQYFEEGEKRILLSPASVDMGGVCITPREEDFRKISKDDIADIFRQVSISKEYFVYLSAKIEEGMKEEAK